MKQDKGGMLAEPQSADKHRPAKPFGDAFGVTERAKYYRQYAINADYADITALTKRLQ